MRRTCRRCREPRHERMLDALEDAEDATAFDAAMAEEGPSIPWDQVKLDLGWM